MPIKNHNTQTASPEARRSRPSPVVLGRFRSVGEAFAPAEKLPAVIRDATVGVLGALQPPRRTFPYPGRLAAAAVTAVGGAGIALGVAQSSGPVGCTLVVAFVLVAPALAIIRLLPSVNAA